MDVQVYLTGESKFGAILGPFDSPPIETHLPLMTCPKPNGSHRRVIVDLSFPHTKSVNAGVCKDIYLGTPYQLTLPTIDVITNQVKALGKGCSLYKVDISRTFHQIRLDPADYDLLGLCHGAYYVNTCLLFRFRHRSALFQQLSDAVHHIMRRRDCGIINYIDDVMGIDLPSNIQFSFTLLKDMLKRF